MYGDSSEDNNRTEEDYMRQLYERFRKEVESGQLIDYYEIDELLDIYDYAQDEGDAMVQMYVFLTAGRLHPGARDFDERLAFFLSYVSQDAADEMFERAGRQDSALWDVLRMGVKCFPAGNPEPYLKKILSSYDSLDCESTLKIIDLLRDMDHRDLLVKYYPQLLKAAEDPRGFSFEVAETIKEDQQYLPQARKIAEELTSREPFNIEAWLLLTRMEFGLGNADEALAAVDYALAIDPDNFNARLAKGVVMVVMDSRRKEAVEILSEILKENPTNLFALEGLAEAFSRDKDFEKAADIFVKIITLGQTLASGSDPVYALVDLDIPSASLQSRLKTVLASGKRDITYWQDLLDYLAVNEKYEKALDLVTFLDAEMGHNWDAFYLNILYKTRQYARFESTFLRIATDSQLSGEQPDFLSLTHFLMLAASYLHLGEKEKATEVCTMIENKPQICRDVDEHLRLRGIRFTARLISTLAAAEKLPDNFDEFDPLMADFLP